LKDFLIHAIHSYVAIARPRANPDPFIATNCSARK